MQLPIWGLTASPFTSMTKHVGSESGGWHATGGARCHVFVRRALTHPRYAFEQEACRQDALGGLLVLAAPNVEDVSEGVGPRVPIMLMVSGVERVTGMATSSQTANATRRN